MRRRPLDASRPPKRPATKKASDQGPGLASYLKVVAFSVPLLLIDHVFEQRVALLIPLYTLWRSAIYIQRTDGLLVTFLVLMLSFLVDWMCLLFVPIHWLFFVGSVHQWVQILWHADSDLNATTILLFICFVYVEAVLRLHTIPFMYVYRLLAAHSTGSPLIMLVLDIEELLRFKIRKHRRNEVEFENRFYLHLIEGSLPPAMRLQSNEYALSEKGEQQAVRSHDMEVHNHSGFIMWMLRFIFQHVSGWLDSTGPGSDGNDGDARDGENSKATRSESGSGGSKDSSACDSTPAAENLSTQSSGHAANQDGTVVTHRRRPDPKPDSRAHAQVNGGSTTGTSYSKTTKSSSAASASAGERALEQSSASSTANGPVPSNKSSQAGSAGAADGGSVSGASGGSHSTVESGRHTDVPKVSGGNSGVKKQSTGAASQSPVASGSSATPSQTSQASAASKKETRLQQELVQLKSKWIASREREDRLSDQVDGLRDSQQKLQRELRTCHDDLREALFELDCKRNQLETAQATNNSLRKDCTVKADQVTAARHAHDTAENELREFMRKLAMESSSVHDHCLSAQQSMQREIFLQSQSIQQLQRALAGEKRSCKGALEELERCKVECVKLERNCSAETREKMELLSVVRDIRKELDRKTRECTLLEQQVTEALAVMPMPSSSFLPDESGESPFGRQSSSLLGSMDDFREKAMQFGSLMANDGDDDSWPADLTPSPGTQIPPVGTAATPQDPDQH